MKGVVESFVDLNKLLKNFENMDPDTERFPSIGMFMVQYLFIKKSMVIKETSQAHYHGHVSEEYHLPEKSLSQVFQEVF